jgi:hypothetical protein
LRLLTLLCSFAVWRRSAVGDAQPVRATHRKDGAGGALVATACFPCYFLTYLRRFSLVSYTYREHKKRSAPSLNTFVKTKRGFGYTQARSIILRCGRSSSLLSLATGGSSVCPLFHNRYLGV